MDILPLISVLVLLFLIILFKDKAKNLVKDNIYIQTFLILIIIASVIRDILFFRNEDILSYISLGVLFLGLGVAIPRYIKKLKNKG